MQEVRELLRQHGPLPQKALAAKMGYTRQAPLIRLVQCNGLPEDIGRRLEPVPRSGWKRVVYFVRH
jgi:hypothetical protein